MQRDLATGIWHGSPQVQKNRQWYDDNFYATLAAKKVWKPGTSPYDHALGGPITWDIVPIPQKAPPPCDQPQPTGYDAESCRYVNSLFKDLAKTDPAAAMSGSRAPSATRTRNTSTPRARSASVTYLFMLIGLLRVLLFPEVIWRSDKDRRERLAQRRALEEGSRHREGDY